MIVAVNGVGVTRMKTRNVVPGGVFASPKRADTCHGSAFSLP
jgi:hypothetical protein